MNPNAQAASGLARRSARCHRPLYLPKFWAPGDIMVNYWAFLNRRACADMQACRKTGFLALSAHERKGKNQGRT